MGAPNLSGYLNNHVGGYGPINLQFNIAIDQIQRCSCYLIIFDNDDPNNVESAIAYSDAFEKILALLEHTNEQISHQAIWCIGNICGDSVELAQFCDQHEVGQKAVHILEQFIIPHESPYHHSIQNSTNAKFRNIQKIKPCLVVKYSVFLLRNIVRCYKQVELEYMEKMKGIPLIMKVQETGDKIVNRTLRKFLQTDGKGLFDLWISQASEQFNNFEKLLIQCHRKYQMKAIEVAEEDGKYIFDTENDDDDSSYIFNDLY
ncbi:MAG: hypothetical protein EZS28_000827 [Streblomastix strix]|uniref:Uncharacterized protein n=1 Tax=Streblomastix strix TaxID=222440 RepID=A0A5J4X9S7_9EUKA|nr:MAG: hypothetical protein EZS28_000827 [Streblomastix strix]